MIIIFQELKQNWVVKVRLNIEFLQPRKLLKVSSNIWGSLQKQESNILITIIVQHKETALLQMNTGIKPFRNILNFILFHPAT
ncbi:hypothetical protein A4W78_00660 [Latilactobacillus curvatus]|nr:hypothetical protein A4W78_00660 [Latilactobacillus curvatus]